MTRSSCCSPRKERLIRKKENSKEKSKADHAVLDEFGKLATKERLYEIHLEKELPKPKPTKCVTPQEKGRKSKSGKGGNKSKSRSPKATRHRAK